MLGYLHLKTEYYFKSMLVFLNPLSLPDNLTTPMFAATGADLTYNIAETLCLKNTCQWKTIVTENKQFYYTNE